MIEVNRLVSDAQNEINDIAMELIQPKEWVDMVNDVAKDLAEATKMYIARYSQAQNPLGEANVCQININEPIHKIIRVVRGSELGIWKEQREYSKQAVSATISGNYSFGINNVILNNAFATKRVNLTDDMDGSITLTFTEAFEQDEILTVDYSTYDPFASNPFVSWSPSQQPPVVIPDFLRNAFRLGLVWRATSRLFNKRIDNNPVRSQMALNMYNGGPDRHFNGGYLRQAAVYAKSFMDDNSKMQMQDINILRERE